MKQNLMKQNTQLTSGLVLSATCLLFLCCILIIVFAQFGHFVNVLVGLATAEEGKLDNAVRFGFV